MDIERFDFKLELETVSKEKPLLIFGDATRILKHLKPNSIDMIIDDMGYSDLEVHRNIGTTTRLKKSKGSHERFYTIGEYTETIPLYRILLKKAMHLYIWRPSFNEQSIHNWNILLNPQNGLLIKNKFRFRKAIPCIKNYNGMGYSYRSAHERLVLTDSDTYGKPECEEIIFAVKRAGGINRNLNDLSLPDYFLDEWKKPHDKTKTHVSEKPTTIYKKIMLASSNYGEIVLEPFAGSFQSGIANTKFNLKRRVIGIEVDKQRFNTTIKNFKDETGREPDVKYLDEMELS